MAKLPLKAKSKPKNEVKYTRTIVFKYEPTYDERESIIRRAIFSEQNEHEGKPLRWIVTEKTMEQAKINFFVKQLGKQKK